MGHEQYSTPTPTRITRMIDSRGIVLELGGVSMLGMREALPREGRMVMCDIISQFETVDRRKFLTRAGVVTGAAITTVIPTAAAAAAAASPDVTHGPSASRHRTRVILLGTTAGPVWRVGGRQGTSSVLTVGDAAYLIDCGDGFGAQWMEAGLGDPTISSDFSRLRGVFLTHLHTDHTIDLPALLLYGYRTFGGSGQPVTVFGPGRRGGLPPMYPPGRPEPPVVNPDNPTPGTEDMVASVFQMFAADINERMRYAGFPDPRNAISAQDIVLPSGVGDNPDVQPIPTLTAPIEVYEDDLVRVTATLADHGAMFPSFAFRFDTPDGSVVFSGDTTVHGNITSLAENVDVLVHEVVDEEWARGLAATWPPEQQEAFLNHVVGSHTTIEQVGPVAESAGARALVLNHLAPSTNPRRRWMEARHGYSGKLIVGDDLMQIGVGSRSR